MLVCHSRGEKNVMNREHWILARRALRVQRQSMNSITEILNVVLCHCSNMNDIKALRNSLGRPFWNNVDDKLIRRTMPMSWYASVEDRIRISGIITGPVGTLV